LRAAKGRGNVPGLFRRSEADSRVSGWDSISDSQKLDGGGHSLHERVSTSNSLVTGKITGQIDDSRPTSMIADLMQSAFQGLTSKFPTQANRELPRINWERSLRIREGAGKRIVMAAETNPLLFTAKIARTLMPVSCVTFDH
jgi:hypothetical protein